jgi:hypothetical protein
MSCVTLVDWCITRGDIFELDVGLSTDWPEVIADPAGYLGTVVFRETQSDDDAPLLSLTAIPLPTVNPIPGDAPVYMEFTGTSGETQQLPDYDIVAYCEIAPISDLAQSRRLFNVKVKIND